MIKPHVSVWALWAVLGAFVTPAVAAQAPTPAAPPAVQAPAPAAAPPAQASANPATVCNLPIPAPAALPPAGSGPVIYQIVPCFPTQGNVSTVEPETYL
jgi:2-oxoglutarate dehydrogenase E2 component (dihydrolipoamide succinyltransferase)